MDLFSANSVTDLFDMPPMPVSENLQRTEKWFKDREGRFTGSEIYILMGTTRSTSKAEWGRPEKIIDLSETVKAYIYAKAKERQRKKVIRQSIGYNGTYGEIVEKLTKKMLIEKYPDINLKEVGFCEFIKGVAGASPDGQVFDNMALEIKGVMDWKMLYKRFETPFDESHKDFWQVTAEMTALNVAKCMYVVAEPSKDPFAPEIDNINEKIIEISPIHQEALIQRCMLGNDIIKLYLSGVNFQEAVRRGCTNFDFNTDVDTGEYETTYIAIPPVKNIEVIDPPF